MYIYAFSLYILCIFIESMLNSCMNFHFSVHVSPQNHKCNTNFFHCHEVQVRHRRTCRKARAPEGLSSARLCDPSKTQLSAGDTPAESYICLIASNLCSSLSQCWSCSRLVSRPEMKKVVWYFSCNSSTHRNITGTSFSLYAIPTRSARCLMVP